MLIWTSPAAATRLRGKSTAAAHVAVVVDLELLPAPRSHAVAALESLLRRNAPPSYAAPWRGRSYRHSKIAGTCRRQIKIVRFGAIFSSRRARILRRAASAPAVNASLNDLEVALLATVTAP
jgi:hypothetical protein